MSELSRRGAALIEHPAMAAPAVAVVAGRARRYRFRRRMRAAVATCALVAVVAGGVAWRSAGSAPMPQPWAAAGAVTVLPAPAVAAVPAGPAPAHGLPGTWRLASYLSEPASWRRSNGGPAAGGWLSCPQGGTCYYAGAPGGGSPSGPGKSLTILYVSHDGGRSWSAIRMTGGASFTTALACPASGNCLAGGEVFGQSVLLATRDGGRRWAYRALPSGDGVISQLSCPTLESCRALASRSDQPGISGPARTWFLATDDAGAHWSAVSFPAGDAISALSCLTAADCVVVGTGTGRPNAAGDSPMVALRTRDGGRAWAAGAVPDGMSYPSDSPGTVACAGTSTCYALALYPQRWVPQAPVAVPVCGTCVRRHGPSPGRPGPRSAATRRVIATLPRAGGKPSPVVFATARVASSRSHAAAGSGVSYLDWSVVAVSRDGGASWRTLALPPGVPSPSMDTISCPAALDCWVAGEEAVPQNIPGGGYNGGSAVILATSDGGASWSKTTFAAGRLASGQQADSLMAVGEIACQAVNSCLGIGAADQGSYHTPVYTNAGG